MRKLAVMLLVAGLGLPSGSWAEAPARWLFGVESRFSPSVTQQSTDYDFGFIPNFSYYLSERVRVDGFLGFSYAEGNLTSLTLSPGVRYYHRRGPGRVLLNSGLSVGFNAYERDDTADELRLREQFPETSLDSNDEKLFVRLVPLELEYWTNRRGAFTVGLDYQARLYSGGTTEGDAFGVTAGFRFRLK